MRTSTRRTRSRRRPRPRRTRCTRCTAHRRSGSRIQPTVTKHIATITLQTRF